MDIACPVCGVSHSGDSPCPACQTQITLLPSAPTTCPVADGLDLNLTSKQLKKLLSPLDSVMLTDEERYWRVHWVADEAWAYWQPFTTERVNHSSSVLPTCRIAKTDGGVWVIAESTGESIHPWSVHADDPEQHLQDLLTFAKALGTTLEELHKEELLWLTFDPGCLQTTKEGLWLTNLDLQFFPFGYPPKHFQPHTHFGAPELYHLEPVELKQRTDVFSFALFCYYWIANFLPYGFPGKGLPATHFHIPFLRIYAPQLPPKVISILEKGMALNPDDRFQTVHECYMALQETINYHEQRQKASPKIQREIAGCSLTGKAKEAANKANEDHVLICEPDDSDRAFLAIADGVSQCDIGNGALASRLACLVLENSFNETTTAETFPDQLCDACLRCGQTLLDWAVEQGFREHLLVGKNLMATTLTAVWLQRNNLTIGNLGDSRAYLIDGDHVEQLTVDGDVRSSLLSLNVPPEEVILLGKVGNALRTCIGGCKVDMYGELAVPVTHCQPAITNWTIVPGDVLVICSDGLVEEGAFLNPEDLANIVNDHREESAEDIAVALCQAANERQRLPSLFEADGFGDNVSCVVVKFTADSDGNSET